MEWRRLDTSTVASSIPSSQIVPASGATTRTSVLYLSSLQAVMTMFGNSLSFAFPLPRIHLRRSKPLLRANHWGDLKLDQYSLRYWSLIRINIYRADPLIWRHRQRNLGCLVARRARAFDIARGNKLRHGPKLCLRTKCSMARESTYDPNSRHRVSAPFAGSQAFQRRRLSVLVIREAEMGIRLRSDAVRIWKADLELACVARLGARKALLRL